MVVHSTFTQLWEMKSYVEMVDEFFCSVYIISLFDGECDDKELSKRSIQKFDSCEIKEMRDRW